MINEDFNVNSAGAKKFHIHFSFLLISASKDFNKNNDSVSALNSLNINHEFSSFRLIFHTTSINIQINQHTLL